jgi:hypothetical protein
MRAESDLPPGSVGCVRVAPQFVAGKIAPLIPLAALHSYFRIPNISRHVRSEHPTSAKGQIVGEGRAWSFFLFCKDTGPNMASPRYAILDVIYSGRDRAEIVIYGPYSEAKVSRELLKRFLSIEAANHRATPTVSAAIDHWLANKNGQVKKGTLEGYTLTVAHIRGPLIVAPARERSEITLGRLSAAGRQVIPMLGDIKVCDLPPGISAPGTKPWQSTSASTPPVALRPT